jgi:hypothetical protein
MSEFREFVVKLKSDGDQKNLHSFGVKTKTKAEDDQVKAYQRRVDELELDLMPEGYDGEVKAEFGNIGPDFVIHITNKTDDKKKLLSKKVVTKAIVERLRVSVGQLEVKEKNPKVCVSCDEAIKDNEGYETNEAKPICCSCYDQDRTEPCATVIYSDDPDEPKTIGAYHNETEGDFEAVYHRTDGWRGYYDIKCSDAWEQAHSDCILGMSEDEKELKNFDDYLKELLDDREIRWARVISRTSNLFSQGYDFFVEKGKLEEIELIVANLKNACRDPHRFQMTALTGKDPKNFTKEDEILCLVANFIKSKTGDDNVQN